MHGWPSLLGVAASLAIAALPICAPLASQPPTPIVDRDTYDAMIEQLQADPPLQTADRIPKGYKFGRCLLEVEGETLVSGPCAYTMLGDGSFQFHGSRQVHAGIDYPDIHCSPCAISTDYFVYVQNYEEEVDPATGTTWYAHFNGDKRATHADAYLGPVDQRGACFTNARTKICLWKS